MKTQAWRLGLLAVAVGLAGCASDASDGGASEDDVVGETATTESEPEGLDCRAGCSGALGGGKTGGLSGERVADVSYAQLATCTPDDKPIPEDMHTLAAGTACWLSAAPRNGQPFSGAFACEAFDCGETGTFRASACIAPALTSAPKQAGPAGTCATREEACAAAREVNASAGRPPLCR